MKLTQLLVASALLIGAILACNMPAGSPDATRIVNATPTVDATSLPAATTQEASPTPLPTATQTPPPPSAIPTLTRTSRQTSDQPDDLTGKQVHLMYVLPSDGFDRSLDTDGVIEQMVTTWQNWLADQTGGRVIRLDTYQGKLDITFYRLSRTEADFASYDVFMRDQLEAELMQAGFGGTEKLLAVVYEGIHNTTCGDSSWPPVKVGSVAAIYLNGLPTFEIPCSANPIAQPGEQPGYLEFAMLHEILHAIGITPECAPNHTRAGHTSDSNTDLMYAGDEAWYPSVLDLNHDDYYLHDNPGCLDLDDSGWLT